MRATEPQSAVSGRWIDDRLDRLRDPLLLIGRVLIAALFIDDATLMVRFADANAAYMEQFGLSGLLLYPTALLQFAGGVLVLFGAWTRPAALALAAFCLATALVFHHQLADTGEIIQFGKDIGLAGGYLFLAAEGAGTVSVDHRLRRSA